MKSIPTPILPILRALLSGLIDYAGLFPPASLDLRTAVAAYHTYRRGPWAWALGRFVVGAPRLDELSVVAAPLLPSGEGAVPWRVSALVGADVAADCAAIEDFNARHAGSEGGRALVDVAEVKVNGPGDVGRVAEAVPPALRVAYEVPLGDELDACVAAVARARGVVKARLGGVVPSAIPPVDRVAAWLWSAARHGVAVKATAGLHHPVRGEYALTYEAGAPRAVMHGFVNVFLAACLAARAGADADRGNVPEIVRDVLAETGRRAFRFDEHAVVWRDLAFTAAEVEGTRARFALSFGSCSFEEPIEGLRLEP